MIHFLSGIVKRFPMELFTGVRYYREQVNCKLFVNYIRYMTGNIARDKKIK